MGVWNLFLSALVSTGGGLVFGYELAVISGALLQLRLHLGLSCLQQEALVSAFLLGALLASAVGGYLIDWQGSRSAIVFSNVLTLAGTVLQLVSSYFVLVLGRAAMGFAVCISSMSCCIFVSERVRPERRGVLVSLYEAGITVGILAAYTVNYIMADSKTGWKWMFGLAVVPTFVQLVSICSLPANTNCSQTQKDLLNLTENQNSTATSSTTTKRYNPMSLFQSQDNMRRRTVIGLGLVLFQQFTGQPNVLLYASTIFHSVCFQSDAAAVLASVGLGLVKVLSTLTSMALSDRAGRRPLLIGGCSVMAVGLITIGLFGGNSHIHKMPCVSKMNMTTHGQHLEVDFYNETMTGTVQAQPSLSSPLDEAANWVILLSLMAVVSAYSVGFGPLTWLLLSEIFPSEVRGRAFAFTNCFNWSANLLVTFSFLSVMDAIGLSRLFVLYGAISVAAAGFFYVMLPETKGKLLEEIDRELRLKRFDHTEDCCGFIRRNPAPQYHRLHCVENT